VEIMKVLKSWLKDFIDWDLSLGLGTEPRRITDDELVSKLTLTGTEVAGVALTVDRDVVVVEIKKIKKHPNADKLQIAKVFDGKEVLEIVCGAPNIAVGQKVSLAKIGATVGGKEIKEVEIRGINSFGMLCSEFELGLGDDHSGIKILDQNAPLGIALADYLKADSVFNLEITPNRGDCLSHIGIARELAAILGKSLRRPPLDLKMSLKRIVESLTVEIEDTNDCPRYYARMLANVKIAPSPKWLQDRLLACGATPINNIVDVTNYIMLDLGQPLHAFDADKIAGKRIVVRRAKNREKITTLDGEKRQLSSENLVIADEKHPLAIAGIMGSFDSQITPETKNIIIEAAEFNPRVIRRASKLLNLTTEASYRFERGIDSGGIQYAIDKAGKLMKETAGGELYSGIVKAGEVALHLYDDEIEYKKINNLIGLNLKDQEIDHILKSLGFLIEDGHFIVPSWRHDIECWQDIAEEIGRIYGYEKIKQIPLPKSKEPNKSFYYFKEYLKDILVDLGFTEVYNYSFLSASDLSILADKEKDLLEVKNPIQPENKYLRNSLVPGILKSIAKNSSFDDILIFEIGNVFTRSREKTNLAIAVSGKRVSSLSGVTGQFCARIGMAPAVSALPTGQAGDRQAKIKIQRFESADLKTIKIRKPFVEIAEIDLEHLAKDSKYLSALPVRQAGARHGKTSDLGLKISKKEITYRPISKFPSVTRDLAFIVGQNISVDKVAVEIYKISDLVNRVEVFDEFASDKFGKGKKNIAFHIFLQAQDRTLKDSEVNAIIKEIISAIEKKYKAKLRK